MERIIRPRDIASVVGLGRSTIYEREARGDFPARRQLGGGLVGWLESEVTEWLRSRPVGIGDRPSGDAPKAA